MNWLWLSDQSPWAIFMWWERWSLSLWHKPTELAPSLLFCSCIGFCLYGPFNCISFHKFSQQLFHFLTLFFQSFFCLTGPFNYTSLYESLPQPWYNLVWLTGLKAPSNWLTNYLINQLHLAVLKLCTEGWVEDWESHLSPSRMNNERELNDI